MEYCCWFYHKKEGVIMRLTRVDEDGTVLCLKCVDEECNGNCLSCEHDIEAMEKLAEYEDTGLMPEQIEAMKGFANTVGNELAEYKDLEEQGLILRLPVAEGTPVWTVMCGMNGKNPTLFRQDFEVAMLQYWGKAVFLTKAEAEQVLESMVKENGNVD
jgi:hypothetical protein